MVEKSETTTSMAIKDIFDSISHKYDLLNRIISFGQDNKWRHALIKSVIPCSTNKGVLCDIATGTGDIALLVAKQRTDYEVIKGYDISPNMLSIANEKLDKFNIGNSHHKKIIFIEADVAHLPAEANSANAITVGFGVRNFPNRSLAFGEFNRILKMHGSLSILEILPPTLNLNKAIFNAYFNHVMPNVASLFSSKKAYSYLHASVAQMPNSKQLSSELSQHGFAVKSIKTWILGSVNLIVASKIKNIIVLLFLLFSSIFSSGHANAQNTLNSQLASSPYTIQLYTFGAGDSLEEWWGHIGLFIRNNNTRQEDFYNWGMFNFDFDLVKGYATGKLRFWAADEPLLPTISFYKRYNRDIKVAQIYLSPQKTNELVKLVQDNVLPQNREYDYEYFKDNCSTRIRDLLDKVLQGQLSEQYKNTYSNLTARDHIHILMSPSPFMDLLSNFLLGPTVDKKLSAWDEMFLPEQLEKHLSTFTYQDSSFFFGKQALLQNEHYLYKSTRIPKTKAINYFPGYFLFGMAWAIMAFIFSLKQNNKVVRKTSSVSLVLLGIILGMPSLILFVFNVASGHTYTYWNLNLLFGGPISIYFVVFGIRILFNKSISKKSIRIFSWITLAMLCVLFLVKATNMVLQDNLIYAVFFIPVIVAHLFLMNSLSKAYINQGHIK